MTILEAFEILPLSERTLIKHSTIREGVTWKGLELHNDLGHPCEWRIVKDNKDLGMVKYYKGRKLSCYKLREG